jgi:hypothetical protein
MESEESSEDLGFADDYSDAGLALANISFCAKKDECWEDRN